MPQQCCSLGINITVVNRVIGSNLKCFWFLHLATILILLRLFFCRRRKKKAFIFLAFFLLVDSIFLLEKSVSGFPLTSVEHAVQGLKKHFAICVGTDCRREKAGKKMFSFFSVGNGALRQFILWFACFWAASVKHTDAYRLPNDWELHAHLHLVLIYLFMSSFCQNLSPPHVYKVQ